MSTFGNRLLTGRLTRRYFLKSTGAIATYPIYPPDTSGRYDGRALSNPAGDGSRNGPYKYALKASNTGL